MVKKNAPQYKFTSMLKRTLTASLACCLLVACGQEEAAKSSSPPPKSADGAVVTTSEATKLEMPQEESVLRREILNRRNELDRLDAEVARRDLLKNSISSRLTETEQKRALIVVIEPTPIPSPDDATDEEIEAATLKNAAEKKKADEATAQRASLATVVTRIQGELKVVDDELLTLTQKIKVVEDEIAELTKELNKIKVSQRDAI